MSVAQKFSAGNSNSKPAKRILERCWINIGTGKQSFVLAGLIWGYGGVRRSLATFHGAVGNRMSRWTRIAIAKHSHSYSTKKLNCGASFFNVFFGTGSSRLAMDDNFFGDVWEEQR